MTESIEEQAVASPSIEELYQRLPPLDSDEYAKYVRVAPRAELPPEVLVRAYRQLPPDAPGARATLERLFRRVDSQWEYLQPLVRAAKRQCALQQRRSPDVEFTDIFQDAMRRIWEVLPAARGALAERAWNTFCRNESSNAWRERYGRRGQRLDPIRAELRSGSDEIEQEADPLDRISDDHSLWQVLSQQDKSEQIEAIAAEVAKAIEDPFVQGIARAAWFANDRPKTSGTKKPDKDPPLMEQFPGKSRDQINRALLCADRRLAAALLSTDISWPPSLRELLEKQQSRGERS